jgi:glycosyltransferase involved in cell wall biosynthesis
LVVGFVGRLVRDKGICELEAAWKGVRLRYPNAYLLVVGFFEERDSIPAEVRRRLEQDDRVRLAGTVWDTPPMYAAMDLLCLPSFREGLPGTPLEASAMRLPVVATRIPGCIDAVRDGVTGTLVEPGNVAQLESAIVSYLSDDRLRLEHGVAGRQWVIDQFQRERLWAAIANEYGRLIDQHDGAPSSDRESVRQAVSQA